MPQPKKGPRLGSNPSHQRLMLANLAGSLFEHEKIRTTEAKAKALRPFAEKLITKAKKGDVHNRRQVLAVIEDREIVHKLFDDIGPRFAERNGGYTRILKIGPRPGDGAPMALVELVDEGTRPAATTVETPEGKKRRLARPGGRRRRADEAPDAEAAETSELDDDDEELAVEEPSAEASEDDVAEEEAAEAEAEAAEVAAEEATEEAIEAEAAGDTEAAAPDTGGEGDEQQK